jgi:hypothetical protein
MISKDFHLEFEAQLDCNPTGHQRSCFFALVLKWANDMVTVMKAPTIRATKPEIIDHGPGFPFDPEEDSPELEAELLKGIKGPFKPYSEQEMREIGERIIREKRQHESRS